MARTAARCLVRSYPVRLTAELTPVADGLIGPSKAPCLTRFIGEQLEIQTNGGSDSLASTVPAELGARLHSSAESCSASRLLRRRGNDGAGVGGQVLGRDTGHPGMALRPCALRAWTPGITGAYGVRALRRVARRLLCCPFRDHACPCSHCCSSGNAATTRRSCGGGSSGSCSQGTAMCLTGWAAAAGR